MENIFPNLDLLGLGNPLDNGTFRFRKNQSGIFDYMNLSGGEKAIFDLILDIVIKKREFNNTVFVIDEPETHVGTKVQGALLNALISLVPDNCQLWLATHSIGMLRQALEIYRINSESVCFLDFGGKDFDEQQNISPVTPNKSFWRSALEVALDDLSTLVSPSQVVICEGVPHHPSASNNSAIDARCFDIIFSNEFPDCQFLSAGNASDVQSDRIGLLSSIQSIIEGVRITRLIDRDDRSQDEIEELKRSGVRVLSRRHLESYLFDEEVLRDLCISTGNSDCIATVLQARFDAIHASEQRGNSPDDIKSASGQIYVETKRILNLTQCGNSTKTFMRDTLSKHVSPASQIYRQLKEDIFGA